MRSTVPELITPSDLDDKGQRKRVYSVWRFVVDFAFVKNKAKNSKYEKSENENIAEENSTWTKPNWRRCFSGFVPKGLVPTGGIPSRYALANIIIIFFF